MSLLAVCVKPVPKLATEAIDKVPFIVNPVLNVVVPELIVKLLNEVNNVDGKVLLALIITVPDPEVQEFPVTAVTIMLPLMFIVPPALISIIPAAFVPPLVLPTFKLPVLKTEPFEKVIVPVLAAAPFPPNMEFPETANV